MQDDLKERLRYTIAYGVFDAIGSGKYVTHEDCRNYIEALEAQLQAKEDGLKVRDRRIKALEAKLAEKDALLRECGEAAGRLNDQVVHILLGKACGADISAALEELKPLPFALVLALAKIKEATDA